MKTRKLIISIGIIGILACGSNVSERDNRPSCVKIKRDNGGVQPSNVDCKS